jgi:hypothetical protein
LSALASGCPTEEEHDERVAEGERGEHGARYISIDT